jgi:hypothetical protein
MTEIIKANDADSGSSFAGIIKATSKAEKKRSPSTNF